MAENLAVNMGKASVQRPFLGLRSYEEKNKEQFGGRDIEIRELYALVEDNRLTIIFGKSGIGKTSLIKAGLIPQLQKKYFFPIYLRIDYNSSKSPLVQAKELIFEKLKTRDSNVTEIGSSTLWEYFSKLKLLDNLLTPVIIFDQFEEIFTIGSEKSRGVQEFIVEVSDLAENRVPMVLQNEWKNRNEMPASFNSRQNFHMIISLREDYLANLESLKGYLPSIKNSRFRVLQMTAIQAMNAVLIPASGLIDKEVAIAIVKKLPGITDLDFEITSSGQDNTKRFIVEPFLLSLICYEINEKRIEKGLDKITGELVSNFDISDVINSYYSKTMQDFGEGVQRGIENNLLTESGFRKLQELGELEREYNIKDEEIMKLIEKRIIRKEMRDGVDYVELIHDVLTPVIKSKRDRRVFELKEKEKAEAIKKAIEQDRGKRRRLIMYGALFLLPILLILLWVTIEAKKETERKLENRSYAKELILASRILSNAYADDSNAALISRTAFIINRNNDGQDEIDFYNSMYAPLRNKGFQFAVAQIDSCAIRDIVLSNNETFYFAGTNGKIYRKNSIDGVQELFFDVGEGKRIMSMAISPDKKYLAVAGIFSDVKVFDLSKESPDPYSFSTGDSSGTSRTVIFSNDGNLILRLTNRIIGWDIGTQKRIIWHKRNQIEIDQGKVTSGQKGFVENELDYFEYNGVGNFRCIAALRQKIAIGADSAIIIISKDSLIKIRSEDFGSPTSVEFDPSGTYLFIGNTLGTLCRMSLREYSTEINQRQTARITDIALSNDGRYMASSSYDHSTAIWDMKDSWNSISPLVLLPPDNRQEENIWCVSFTADNKYVLAGYWSGKILKWPVNTEILAELICSNFKTKLDYTVLSRVLNKKIGNDLKQYECMGTGTKKQQ